MRTVVLAVCLTLLAPPLGALAESPSPPPSPPTRPPSPSPSGPAARSPSPSPSVSASASPSPSPTPAASVAPEIEAVDAAVAEEMRRAIAATSLLERIDAQRRLAAAERDVLVRETARLRAAQDAAAARLADLRARLAEDRARLERLLEETYRASRTSSLEALLKRGSIIDLVVHVDSLARLSAQQRELIDQIRASERAVAAQQAELTRDADQVAGLTEAIAVKDATLARLAARAEALAAAARLGPAAASDAEIELLRDLAEQAAREHEETDRIVAAIAARTGQALPALDRWEWPATGPVTQEFGPTALGLEPAMTYRGVPYPHFHDGIDVAAPLGSPVRAVAKGRVAFVGHLAGGAMVVIVVHDGGLVSLYGHLDDAVARPTVRVGDAVEAGQRVGAVGLTGLTTGPHLHFSLRRGIDPVDPLSVLPRRAT